MTMEPTDRAVKEATKATLDQATALARLDQSTLQATAAVSCSMGMQHFQLSQDTRLDQNARKAHRFVAENCKYLARKILQLSGLPDNFVEEQLKDIMKQTVAFHRAQVESVKTGAAQSPGPNGTGTA